MTTAQSFRTILDVATPTPVSRHSEAITELLARRFGEHALVCTSLRSAFAALLEAAGIGPGDEIAMSAVTIAHMADLPRACGARVVAVDVDPDTLEPCATSLERAITSRTRMFIATHLFGACTSLRECAAVARRAGVLMVVDAAHAWSGDDEMAQHLWHADVDVLMFSFGPIKTATALGGGVAVMRDRGLCERAARVHDAWPRRSRVAHMRRAVKYLVLGMMSKPVFYRGILRAIERRGGNPDDVLQQWTRGFGGVTDAADLLRRVRVGPDAALLATLRRRVAAGASTMTCRRARLAGALVQAVPTASIPGTSMSMHTRWLVPVVCHGEGQMHALRGVLRAAGFDAVPLGATNLVTLGDARTCPGAWTLQHALLLPSMTAMPERDAKRLTDVLNEGLRVSRRQLDAATSTRHRETVASGLHDSQA